MAYRPVPARPVRLDHGRRQLAEVSPLAEMARNSEPGAHCGGRPPRAQSLCHRQSGRPGAFERPHFGTQCRLAALSQAAGLGLLARPKIAAVLHRPACPTAAWWNFAWRRRPEQEWKESSEIAILRSSPAYAGASATNVKGNNL